MFDKIFIYFMQNEVIILIHASLCFLFTFLCLRAGKEALIVWISLQGILANLFVLKQIECFGMTITCSDVYVIGLILALNFLQEFFGKEIAKKATWLSFSSMAFFSVTSFIHLNYTPSLFDNTQEHYKSLFDLMPKFTIISLLVFFISQRFDVFFFGFLRKNLDKIPLSIRSGISMVCSQILDTSLFTFFALRDVVENPLQVFFVSVMIKCFVIFYMTTFLQIAKRCLPSKVQPV
jgi:uncharacterized integral membrane protein (TIGR00697 family)